MPDLSQLNSQHFETDGRKVPPIWLKGGPDDRKVIHIAGLGDVGRTMAIGLTLEGGDAVERIGLFDLNPDQCRRMAAELGQISYPCGSRRTPDITVLPAGDPAALFACDVFLFCATKAVPEVGSGITDVRMAQYEANRGIISIYARQASECGFKGLFGVVSDPVELLCRAALTASLEAAGSPGAPAALTPNQIQGFGMGVMYARAAYYAKTMDVCTCSALAGALSGIPESKNKAAVLARLFLDEGRVFGLHGQELIVANSTDPAHYDDALSRRLTELTVQANREVRALGFKPFIAPALSSAALTVLGVIRGEWTDSSTYMGGLYFGCRNRLTAAGTERESYPDMPEALFLRIKASYERLDELASD